MSCQGVRLFGLCAVALVGACVDEASVGNEKCLGANTSCTAPPAHYIFSSHFVEVNVDGPPVLAPVWSRVVPLPAQTWDPETSTRPPDSGGLMGGGPQALWVARTRSDQRALQLFRLNLEGQVVEESELVAQEPVYDLSFPVEEGVPYDGPQNAVRISGAGPLTQSAPGPIVSIGWTQPCAGTAGEYTDDCLFSEVVALNDEGATPTRYLHRPAQAAFSQAEEGAIWELSNVLKKLGPDGEVEIQQTQVGLEPGDDQLNDWRFWPPTLQPMANLVSGGVAVATWLFNEQFQRPLPELWRLDTNGNVSFRASLPQQPKAMTSLIDSQGRWVLVVTNDEGDLEVSRVDTDGRALVDSVRVYREGYPDLAMRSATLDAADNVYILTETGSRSSVTPMVCRYPAQGDTSCLLAPDLITGEIVGGEAGAFYAAPAVLDEVPTKPPAPLPTTAEDLILKRYEWPEP